jgi:hypothetical protein
MVLETVSVSHGKASAYLPVIDLLRNYFDISATDDERKRREKVAGKMSSIGVWRTRCHISSVCWASSKAMTRWRRWTGRFKSVARWTRSSGSSCARASISR